MSATLMLIKDRDRDFKVVFQTFIEAQAQAHLLAVRGIATIVWNQGAVEPSRNGLDWSAAMDIDNHINAQCLGARRGLSFEFVAAVVRAKSLPPITEIERAVKQFFPNSCLIYDPDDGAHSWAQLWSDLVEEWEEPNDHSHALSSRGQP